MLKIRAIKPVKIRIRKNPFVWDGTFIGFFDNSVIINESKFDIYRYIELNLWSFKSYAIIVSSTSVNLLCIYDELKEVFGLIKTGTHSISIGGKKYVIYQASSLGSTVQFDENISSETLEKYKHLKELKYKIMYLFTYRHLLGVSPNSENGIRIRKSGTGFIYPISFNDKFTINKKEGIIKNGLLKVSDRSFDKWFSDKCSFGSIIKEMLHFKKDDDIPEKVSEIRDKIQEIVHRIDKEFVWLENIICTALLDYLEDV